MRLADRTALVTGGASGIGAATCRRLAAEGARVAVTDMNLEGAQQVADEIDGARLRAGRALGGLDPRARCTAAEPDLGPVDVLVNNAGYDEWGFFTNTDPELWERVLAVNLLGVIAVTHAVLPGMQERRRGRIVNIASEAGPGRVERLGHLLGRQGRGDRLHEGDRDRERPLRDHLPTRSRPGRSRRRS